jgi:hypothetical protein
MTNFGQMTKTVRRTTVGRLTSSQASQVSVCTVLPRSYVIDRDPAEALLDQVARKYKFLDPGRSSAWTMRNLEPYDTKRTTSIRSARPGNSSAGLCARGCGKSLDIAGVSTLGIGETHERKES